MEKKTYLCYSTSMVLGINEIKNRAKRFAEDYKNSGSERSEAQSFLRDFFDVFGITQTDSKNPKLDNEYINSNQINTKTEINNGFKYNNNMTQIKQNIYNRLKFNDAPMNVLFQANQKINNLYMYEPKYYNYFPKNKITDEQSINNNISMNDK